VDTQGFGGIALGTGQIQPLIAAEGDRLHGVAHVDLESDAWYYFKNVPSPGCYAWQIDGLDFSYQIVFNAVRE